jgi:hypothetical protein
MLVIRWLDGVTEISSVLPTARMELRKGTPMRLVRVYADYGRQRFGYQEVQLNDKGPGGGRAPEGSPGPSRSPLRRRPGPEY